MENSNIYERILYLVDTQANGNIAQFARIIGVGDQTIRSIVTYKRNYPSYEVIVKIIQKFEWLSLEWFLLGKGKVQKSNLKITEVTPDFLLKRFEELVIENKKLREENSRLKYEKKGDNFPLVAEPTE